MPMMVFSHQNSAPRRLFPTSHADQENKPIIRKSCGHDEAHHTDLPENPCIFSSEVENETQYY